VFASTIQLHAVLSADKEEHALFVVAVLREIGLIRIRISLNREILH
jgi:hypothetical protein